MSLLGLKGELAASHGHKRENVVIFKACFKGIS